MFERPFGEFFRAEFEQHWRVPLGGACFGVKGRDVHGGEILLRNKALRLRIAVDRDVADEVQQLGGRSRLGLNLNSSGVCR